MINVKPLDSTPYIPRELEEYITIVETKPHFFECILDMETSICSLIVTGYGDSVNRARDSLAKQLQETIKIFQS